MIKILTWTDYKIIEDKKMEELRYELDKVISDANVQYRNNIAKLRTSGFHGVREIANISICELSGKREGFYTATILFNTYDCYLSESELNEKYGHEVTFDIQDS